MRTRAVVESPRLLQLQGVNAERVATSAWVLSSVLAALAGVLLAPLYARVDAFNFTVLMVAAIAAAVFGGLRSLPLTLLRHFQPLQAQHFGHGFTSWFFHGWLAAGGRRPAPLPPPAAVIRPAAVSLPGGAWDPLPGPRPAEGGS